MRKRLPYIFLLSLVLVITFLFGVRYGKRVERYDKYFYFLLSLTPKPKKEKSTSPSYSFKFLNLEKCKISFVYPEEFRVEKNELTLKLFQNKVLRTRIDCFEEKPNEKLEGKKVELKFKGKALQGFEKDDMFFFFYQPKGINKLFYKFQVAKNLYPLFSGSVNFEK